MAKHNTVEAVNEIALPIANQMGLKIWDIRFCKEGAQRYLRVFLDRDGGVSVDECADFSRALSAQLDKSDPIPESYMLEVSSPGIERELVRDEHFLQYIGSPVMMRTIRPINGVRDFCGTLSEYKNKCVTVALESGEKITVEKKDASYVKLDDFDFGDFNKEF